MFKLFSNGRNSDESHTADGSREGEPTATLSASGGVVQKDPSNGSRFAGQSLPSETVDSPQNNKRLGGSVCKGRKPLNYFVFPQAFAQAMDGLSDATRLKLYDAMVDYTFHCRDTQFEGMINNIWVLIKQRMDVNIAKAVASQKRIEK